jgi:nitroreductase
MDKPRSVDDIMQEPGPGGYSGQPVPRALIEEILGLARRAPSGVNTQPWEVYVLQGPALARLTGLAVAAAPEQARYFRFFDAPVGLLFTLSRKLGLGSELDYGMFMQTLALAARARGLRTCLQTGWKDLADTVLPLLDAPEDAALLCGMALGYDDPSQPPVEAPEEVPAVETFIIWHN